VLNVHLADQIACGRLTIADFQLASMATNWHASEIPLEAFPNISRWLDGLARPGLGGSLALRLIRLTEGRGNEI
jgi:glutathione S-transferase